MTRPFDQLVSDFLAAQFDAEPLLATSVGVPGYDDRLPDRSATAYADRAEEEDGWLGRFAAASELTPAEEIDRELALCTLRGRVLLRDWVSWRRDPQIYTGPGLSGVSTLFLHRLRPEPELARAAAARLRAVPALLDQGRANLDADLVSPQLLHRALGQTRAAVAYTRDGVGALVSDDQARAVVTVAGAVASEAYAGFSTFLEELAGRAHGDFAIGEQRYSALLREREGLPYGARELRERGQAAYDALAAQMTRRAGELGADDWRALVSELDEDHPATPETMREEYEQWTARARQFCLDRDLVSLPPGESCLVEPAPAFQRPVLAVASYLSPPPFSDSRTGHFFVPFPPDDATEEEADQRLATNSYSAIPSVAVHETWPGHHWHLAWLASAGIRPLRRVLTTPYFSEGWALYAEETLREEGFFTDPRQEFQQVGMRLFRAARIVVDTSLHMGEMTVDDAVAYLVAKTSLSLETAATEVARYCAWPTQASAYLTGALEIARMRADWLAGGGTLRTFHDRLCATGCLPPRLAEKALYAG